MAERVAANDVFDGNAETMQPLSARVLGHFVRTGPNAWDPYQFVAEAGGSLDLLPGVVIQREGSEARFRVRSQGRVVRAEWRPADAETGTWADDSSRQQYFASVLTRDLAGTPALGAAAVIAQKLTEGTSPSLASQDAPSSLERADDA